MKVLFTIGYLFIFGILLNAQTYEIRVIGLTDNVLAVQLRSTSGTPPSTANRVQDLIFGIKWPQSCGANIDLINPTNHSFNIVTSGTRDSKDAYYFRAFGADPTNFTLPTNWTTGAWTTIYTLQSNRQGTGLCNFQICEVGFDATLSNQTGPNLNLDFVDYTPTINGAALIALPVELLNFQAKKREKVADLTWQTASETNVKNFDIEKSFDGKNFSKIAQVKANNTPSVYAAVDEQFLQSAYYRLKINDLDGISTYSKIIFLEKSKIGRGLKIYPNPVQDVLRIETSEAQSLDIVNATGQVVAKQFIQKGLTEYNVSHLAAGVYFIKTGVESLRFVKN